MSCDVDTPDDVKAALDTAVDAFGAPRLRLQQRRHRAAGQARGRHRPRTSGTGCIAINLRGVFLCMKHEIPLMLEHGGGAIVNTSSGAGVKGFAGGAAYGAAKYGVIGAHQVRRARLRRPGIRINAICPGIIDTAMMQRFTGGTPKAARPCIAQEPIGRMGQPEEIAAAVLWLCSDAASFVIGHAMVVDEQGQTRVISTFKPRAPASRTGPGDTSPDQKREHQEEQEAKVCNHLNPDAVTTFAVLMRGDST